MFGSDAVRSGVTPRFSSRTPPAVTKSERLRLRRPPSGRRLSCEISTEPAVGSPTTTVFKTVGSGIELVPVTHPNDLYAGETATFQLLVDGKPAEGLEIEVIPGGSRYRDQQDEIQVVSDAQGRFEVTWPQAGMYGLETTTSDNTTTLADADQRRLSYVATFEVLPQ